MSKSSFLTMYQQFLSSAPLYDDRYDAALRDLAGDLDLSHVTSCVLVGPGTGGHEVEFIKHAVPNLRTLIAVEDDAESVAGLRSRLATDLPAVSSTIHETSFQTWPGPAEPVDLVLLFQVFYYVKKDNIEDFFSKVRAWLNDSGVAVCIHDYEGACITMLELLKPGGSGYELTPTELREAAIRVGFRTGVKKEFDYVADWSDPSELLIEYLLFQLPFKADSNAMRAALKEAYPDGRYMCTCDITVLESKSA